jgi:hypothetical protein
VVVVEDDAIGGQAASAVGEGSVAISAVHSYLGGTRTS